MVISFTKVTPDQYGRGLEDPEWAEELIESLEDLDVDPDELSADDFSGYLDKAWDGIQFLLYAAEVPFGILDTGDPLSDDGSLTGWDVDDVKQAAEVLRATPFERLAGHFDPVVMTERKVYPHVWDDHDLGYLEFHYGSLVSFFDTAAATGSAAFMEFG